MNTQGLFLCKPCKLWNDRMHCEKCGRFLGREESTAEMLADLERSGYITN